MTADTNRTSVLAAPLTAHRRETGSAVDGRIRDGRHRQPKGVGDALARLAAHQYGACAVCGLEISERRLRALPFAVRCKRCEDRREENNDRFREFAKKDGGLGLTHDSVGA